MSRPSCVRAICVAPDEKTLVEAGPDQPTIRESVTEICGALVEVSLKAGCLFDPLKEAELGMALTEAWRVAQSLANGTDDWPPPGHADLRQLALDMITIYLTVDVNVFRSPNGADFLESNRAGFSEVISELRTYAP